MKYLVSSCLMGVNCKYNGGNNLCEELRDLLQGDEVITVCPEVLGGLPTPRACAELHEGRVINTADEDVSDAFLSGAEQAVKIAREHHIDLAILQSRSPSCGVGHVYSGNFDKTLISGNGIFADALIKEGFIVMDIEEFLASKMKG